MRTLILLLFITFYNLKSQKIVSPIFSPGVSIGYCISTNGLSFGLELDVKFLKTKHAAEEFISGISIANTWTKVKVYKRWNFHRHTYFNIVSETQLGYMRFGYGILKNPWGYGNKNLCRIGGVNFDLGYNLLNQNTGYLGFRSFFYKKSNWRWLDKPYYTLYFKYKKDFY